MSKELGRERITNPVAVSTPSTHTVFSIFPYLPFILCRICTDVPSFIPDTSLLCFAFSPFDQPNQMLIILLIVSQN